MEDGPSPPVAGLHLAAHSHNNARVDRWTLALLALHIPFEVRAQGEMGLALWVREPDAERAAATLQAVEEEDALRQQEDAALRAPMALPSSAHGWTQVLALVPLTLSLLVMSHATGMDLMAAGRMDAGAVMAGQTARLFTAVTLHANGAHLLGNLVFLLVVAPTVVHRFGAGVTAAALLFTGAVGNMVSAGYHGAPFGNVGMSGGLFGLLCMLGVLAARTRKTQPGRNRWVLGVGAGLALLSMMGFSEEADITAHLGGFFSAVPLGLWAPLRPQGEKGRLLFSALQGVALVGATGTLGWAWWSALLG